MALAFTHFTVQEFCACKCYVIARRIAARGGPVRPRVVIVIFVGPLGAPRANPIFESTTSAAGAGAAAALTAAAVFFAAVVVTALASTSAFVRVVLAAFGAFSFASLSVPLLAVALVFSGSWPLRRGARERIHLWTTSGICMARSLWDVVS